MPKSFKMQAPGRNVLKLYKKLVFVRGRSSLVFLFVSKVRAYLSETPFVSATLL
jgi:hypothetical protein